MYLIKRNWENERERLLVGALLLYIYIANLQCAANELMKASETCFPHLLNLLQPFT